MRLLIFLLIYKITGNCIKSIFPRSTSKPDTKIKLEGYIEEGAEVIFERENEKILCENLRKISNELFCDLRIPIGKDSFIDFDFV